MKIKPVWIKKTVRQTGRNEGLAKSGCMTAHKNGAMPTAMPAFPPPRKRDQTAYFTRGELSIILSAYSARVASSEWRDYALDHLPGSALFSIFRHAHETPLLVIEKKRQPGKRGPVFLLHDRKRILTRSGQLSELISYLQRMPRLVHG